MTTLGAVVAKRLADPYESRVRWLKIKNPDYTQKEGMGDVFDWSRQPTWRRAAALRTEPIIANRCPLNFEQARVQWEVEKKKFLGANFGCLRDVSPAVLKAFRAALSEGPEEAIQKVITANPYLIQYAVVHSGHQGIWVYPKATIKPPGADGTPGLIPDYLVATRSSLGYFWHVVELKRFDVQFANSDGGGLSSEGHKAVAQCQAYLTHFQDYIDTVRNNVRIPELIQPSGAVLLIGNSLAECEDQRRLRAQFVRNTPTINVVSYDRILKGVEADLGPPSWDWSQTEGWNKSKPPSGAA